MSDKETIIKYIGKRCRELRRKSGMTVQESADKAGISLRTLEAYELGEQEMPTSVAINLAGIYRTTLTKLTNYRFALKDLEIELHRHENE
ncbi:MAG: helix-turn-helix transcriptional regulator [Clostridia bacterium]|nr:helix-turn-helix transcriptional regulator [Clostridia bacterium]